MKGSSSDRRTFRTDLALFEETKRNASNVAKSVDVGFNPSTQRHYRRLIYYLHIHSYMFRSYDHHQVEKYITTLGLLNWQRICCFIITSSDITRATGCKHRRLRAKMVTPGNTNYCYWIIGSWNIPLLPRWRIFYVSHSPASHAVKYRNVIACSIVR
jgi:hypothetical protein